MKKVLVALALIMLPVTGAFAQAGRVEVGVYKTAPQTNCTVGPCYVPNSATNPIYTSPATGATSQAVTTSPGARTIVPLDVATVTTGGTAVTALAAGNKTAGGFLQNPKGATVDLCINEQGTASGTTSAGATTCISPGQTYSLTPSAGAVSVVTSDSAHPFSGYGLN